MIPTLLWLRGFGVTLASEAAVAIPLLRPSEQSVARRASIVLLVNLATHPLVWFFFPQLGWSWTTVKWAAEVWAFGFEIVGYRIALPKATWKRCALVSIAANTTSYVLGLFAIDWGLYG